MHTKQTYITDEEAINCQKVADAFAELYESEDLLVLDAGRYGFVKLQYFNAQFGFDNACVFGDSRCLFDDLWREWIFSQLFSLAKMSFSFTKISYPQRQRRKEGNVWGTSTSRERACLKPFYGHRRHQNFYTGQRPEGKSNLPCLDKGAIIHHFGKWCIAPCQGRSPMPFRSAQSQRPLDVVRPVDSR